MAFQPVDETAEVTLVYATPGGQAVNTLYFRSLEDWQSANLILLADALFEWWNNECQVIQSSSISLVSINAYDLRTENGPFIEYTTGLPIAGGVSTTPILPSNVTLAIQFGTGRRGRSSRGRNFWIGLVEGQVGGDTVNSAHVTAILAAYETLDSYINAPFPNTVNHVVVSRYANGVKRAEGTTLNVLTYSSDGFVDSQRRRLIGRGG